MPEPGGDVVWYRARLHPELRAAVAVPLTRLETERARGVLPREVSLDTARDQARKLAQLLRGLEDLDTRRLRLGVDDMLHTPHRLTLIRGGRQALDAAVAAGALAAAISGSGSAIVALGRGDLTAAAEAMRAAFVQAGESATAFVSGVPASGYRVEALSEGRPT
jgi:homoserine kinase